MIRTLEAVMIFFTSIEKTGGPADFGHRGRMKCSPGLSHVKTRD